MRRQLYFFNEISSLCLYEQCEHYFNIPTMLLLSQMISDLL